MPPSIVSGYGDSAWSPYTGTNGYREINLSTSGVLNGDLVVVCAWTFSTSLVSGDDFGTLLVNQVGIGSAESNGPSNPPGALAVTHFYPTDPIGHATQTFLHVGSCIWNLASGPILQVAFNNPPLGSTAEPGFVNIVIFRDANSGQVAPITDPQETEVDGLGNFDWVVDNTIPFEVADFGHADGRWVNFLGYYGIRDPTNPLESETSSGFLDLAITNQGDTSYSEAPSSTDFALSDASSGSIIDPAQLFFTFLDEGVGSSSPGGDWSLIDQSDGVTSDRRVFYGGSLAVQVWYDPDFNPEFPEEPEDGTGTTVTPLHIPHKDYAMQESQVVLTPYAQHQHLTNWKAVESWADSLRCSGSITTPGGGEGEEDQITTFTPTNGKWKERQLHIPHKESFTSRHVRENYLAFERWANAICPPCHIPHKDWVIMGTAEQEQVNLLTIERWARDIGRCCEGITTTDPGGEA